MAYLKLYKDNLRHNYDYLEKHFVKNNISWGVVTKLLCGNKLYLKELMKLGVKEMLDTRISNINEASSDMLVLDLGDNKKGYKTGDLISFNLRYMGALGLMNSIYIEKVVSCLLYT